MAQTTDENVPLLSAQRARNNNTNAHGMTDMHDITNMPAAMRPIGFRGQKDEYMSEHPGDMDVLEELGIVSGKRTVSYSEEHPEIVPHVSSDSCSPSPLAKRTCSQSGVVFHTNEYDAFATGKGRAVRRRQALAQARVANVAPQVPATSAIFESYDNPSDHVDGADGLSGASEPMAIAKENLIGAIMQSPRFSGDVYTPRWVRGTGNRREGLCVQCPGGRWLLLKQSCYWYHMNYVHGVSPTTGKPYDPPLQLRIRESDAASQWSASVTAKSKGRKEALCRTCGLWVLLRNNADGISGERLSWWRHAQRCENGRMAVDRDESTTNGPAMCLEFRVSPSGDLESVERLFGR